MTSNFLWFLIIGALAGWIAGSVMRGHGFGLWADIIVGIIGAFIGGYLLSLMGFHMYGLVGQLITATLGAIVLIWVMRLFSGTQKSQS